MPRSARKVRRLLVTGGSGELVGIVSRADLLKVFTRPDEAIRSQIISEVIVGDFMLDPSRFFIDVVDGVVVLQGRVERSRLIPLLIRAVHGVEGVVRVEDCPARVGEYLRVVVTAAEGPELVARPAPAHPAGDPGARPAR